LQVDLLGAHQGRLVYTLSGKPSTRL
jgi:hypothetical protein